MRNVKGLATQTSIVTGIVLIAVLAVRALEQITGSGHDPTLDGVLTLVLGAFVTAVTAERVAHSIQSGGSYLSGKGERRINGRQDQENGSAGT